MPPATSSMYRKQALADHVVEQMSAFGRVQAKPMFGGHGIYRDGLMFALIAGEQLYFKTDESTEGEFTRLGLPSFTYEARGKTARLHYHQAPPEVFDDPQHMAHWCRLAYDCALRKRPAAKAGKGAAGRHETRDGTPPARPGRRRPRGEANLAELVNLGPKSIAMLARAGICCENDLREAGAVRAFLRTKAICPEATMNLLWALEGALSGRPWRELGDSDRAGLLMALEDAAQLEPGGSRS